MTEKDFLSKILTVLANNHKWCGTETLPVPGGTGPSTGLNVPGGATYAIMKVECDGTPSDSSLVLRYWLGNTPTATGGIPLGEYDAIAVSETENLVAFQARSVDDNADAILQIQYYK